MTEEVEQAAQPGAEFHVLGVIERKAVLKMLQHRIGFCDSAATCELPENLECDGGSGSGLPEETDELLSLLGSFEQRPFKADSPEDQAAILRRITLSPDTCQLEGPARLLLRAALVELQRLLLRGLQRTKSTKTVQR